MKQPLRVFFASPFRPKYKWIRNGVAEACRGLNMEFRAADEVAPPGANIISVLHQEIANCDLAVALLTSFNPNVMYEIGRLHQMSKPTIMLADPPTLDSPPFDLRTFSIIRYEPKSKSEEDLNKVVSAALAQARECL